MSESPTSPCALFLARLPLIERLIGAAIRRHRLASPDAEDFASTTRLRLLENDCGILRQFQERGSLATFLTVVIERCYLDYRTACWGRWRPSARARRLGPLALALERLVARDGLSFHESCETLRLNHGVRASVDDLNALAARLPVRPKRRMVDESHLADLVGGRLNQAAATIVDDAIQRVVRSLEQALARLPPADRCILEMKFVGQLTVAEIARRRGVKQAVLYRRVTGILGQLKLDLQAQGISGADATAHDLRDVELRWPSTQHAA